MVVDVVFAADLVTLSFEEVGENVSDDGAARVSDVEGSCRVGGDELDVDVARAFGGSAFFGNEQGLEQLSEGEG